MLQTWEALRIEDVKSTGRTRPLIIECEDETGNRKSWLVKAKGLPEVNNLGLYCELLGNLLARELRLDTPTPILVNLSKEFVLMANFVLQSRNFKLEPGLAVGAEFFSKNFSPLSASPLLTGEQLTELVRIYAFDLLVQNPDRRRENPNCAFYGKRLIAFDFNLAFSFLLPILGQKFGSWEVSKHNIYQNHIFFNQLRRRNIDWQPFVDDLRNLSKERLMEICENVPPVWESHTPEICDHLLSAIAKKQEFVFELQRTLSLL